MKKKKDVFEIKKLPAKCNYLAPDGSEIRLLPALKYGGFCHCTLPGGKISDAVKHKTVTEIWYVLSGEGKMWQKKGEAEKNIILTKGACLTIPTGNHFQFRNTGRQPLCILIATMPPWPGKNEAIHVEGKW